METNTELRSDDHNHSITAGLIDYHVNSRSLTPRQAIVEYYRNVTPNIFTSRRLNRHPSGAAATDHPQYRVRSYSQEELLNRPRSNPRTRTPLRNPSPLLIGTLVDTQDTITDADDDIVHHEDAVTSDSHLQPQSHPPDERGQRRMIAFRAGMSSGATLRRGGGLARSNSSSADHTLASIRLFPQDFNGMTKRSTSCKSMPSHRKIRRWNNDRLYLPNDPISQNPLEADFTKLTITYPSLSTKSKIDKEYLMPNAPRSYRSVFATLSQHPSSDELRLAQERFVRGEIASLSDMKSSLNHPVTSWSNARAHCGIHNVSPRLMQIISRSCRSSQFIQWVVRVLESFLLKHLQSSFLLPKNHPTEVPNEQSTSGFNEENHIMNLLIEQFILVQLPILVTTNVNTDSNANLHSTQSNSVSSSETKKICFIFYDDHRSLSTLETPIVTKPSIGKNGLKTHASSKGTKNPAFYRLLVHSISQFHGWNAVTSTVPSLTTKSTGITSKNPNSTNDVIQHDRLRRKVVTITETKYHSTIDSDTINTTQVSNRNHHGSILDFLDLQQ